MKLNIYMKSGNIIRLRGILEWKTTTNDDGVSSLFIRRRKRFFGEKLVVSTIALSQIEAITTS